MSNSQLKEFNDTAFVDQLEQHFAFPTRWAITYVFNSDEPYKLLDTYSKNEFLISENLYELLCLCKSGTFTILYLMELQSTEHIRFKRNELLSLFEILFKMEIFVPADEINILQFHTNGENIKYRNKTISQQIYSPFPIEVELHPTQSCNLRCLHCGNDSGLKRPNELEVQQWMSTIDNLENLGTTHITITGGEPFMYSGMKLLLEHLANKRMRVDILSNGVLLNDRNIELLMKSNFSLTISLDGPNNLIHDRLRGKKCFDRTIQNMSKLRRVEKKFGIEMTVHKKNMRQIISTTLLAIRIGATSIAFGVLFDVGRANYNKSFLLNSDDVNWISQEIKSVMKKYKEEIQISFVDPRQPLFRNLKENEDSNKIFCPGGTTRVAIRSDGLVYPCQYGFCDEKYSMGSITENSIADIWCNADWNLFRGFPIDRLIQCSDCKLNTSCLMKICRLMAYSSKGNFYFAPPGCEWMN